MDWERGLPSTGRSLPQLLKNNGYATALIGKWHLGWKSEFSPGAHGFDYFFGFKSGFVDYYQHTAGGDSPLKADLFENDRPVEVAGYMTDLITERSVRFIEQNARGRSSSTSRTTLPTGPTSRPISPPLLKTTVDTWGRSTIRRAPGQTTSQCSSVQIKALAGCLGPSTSLACDRTR